MVEYAIKQKLGLRDPATDMCFPLLRVAHEMLEEQTPELASLYPFRNQYWGLCHVDQDWVALTMAFGTGPGHPTIGLLKGADLGEFQALSGALGKFLTHAELHELVPNRFGFRKFAYLGPVKDRHMSWPHLNAHFVDWMNSHVLPEVLRRNQQSVLRAIPTPPSFDARLLEALWVLECETDAIQGTAFALNGVGLVTCDHVLGSDVYAFRADERRTRYPVRVIARNSDLDLAVLEIDAVKPRMLRRGSAGQIRMMDHLAVAGFPNYRVGDTGTFVPGMAVGFRQFAGVRRIMTNAPIISGVSGGPVIGANSLVIGIAVTGAETMDRARDAEHTIVPIEALDLLGR